MKKYLYILSLITFLLIPNISLAARTCTPSNSNYSAEVKIDKETFGIGEKAFLTINSTGTKNYVVHYKANQVGYVEIDDTNGIIKGLKDGSVKIDASIDFLEGDEIKGSCSLTIPITIVSNDSSLKSLTLEELDISPIFRSDKFDYEIKLPYRFDKINIIAEANNKGAKITGNGRRYLNEGTNEYSVIVTASNGSTSTYKITILRDKANTDSTLENLIVEGYVLSPKFSKDVYKYSLDLGKEVNEIKINGIPSYEFANIKGTGTFNIATGKNIYYITVVAENGEETKYEIEINKNKGSSKLSKLEVEGYDLDTPFDSDKYIYSLTIKSDINSLKINAESSENDQIEIIGNDNLKFGENEIIVKVTNNDKTTTTYKIIVNKLSIEEEKKIEQNNLLLKILLIIFIVSILFMVLFIMIFIKRNFKIKTSFKKNKKKSNKKTKTKK